jgi:hypothetical protein
MAVSYRDGARLYGGGIVSTGGASIKSIQTFAISLASPNTSSNTTISSITKANTIMRVMSRDAANSTAAREMLTFDITTSTNIAATRGNGSSNSPVYFVELLEFNAGSLTSNQFLSSTTVNQTQVNITITAVDLSKAFAFFHGSRNTQNAVVSPLKLGSSELTSTTNVRFYMDVGAAPGTQTTLGQVVEFA